MCSFIGQWVYIPRKPTHPIISMIRFSNLTVIKKEDQTATWNPLFISLKKWGIERFFGHPILSLITLIHYQDATTIVSSTLCSNHEIQLTFLIRNILVIFALSCNYCQNIITVYTSNQPTMQMQNSERVLLLSKPIARVSKFGWNILSVY